MEKNIIKHATGIVIMNGGDPLDGCPKDWDESNVIIEKLNEGKGDMEPKWSFDCGFKLDYDGGLLSIGSRFYPPKSHYGPTWDGTVHVYLLDKTIGEKKFDCQTLDELKQQVDEYVNGIIAKLEKAFNL
jgi:hypothetical protein